MCVCAVITYRRRCEFIEIESRSVSIMQLCCQARMLVDVVCASRVPPGRFFGVLWTEKTLEALRRSIRSLVAVASVRERDESDEATL